VNRLARLVADASLRAVARKLSPGGPGARLSTLIYHRVLPRANPLNTWDVTAAEFDAQMEILARLFNVLPLAEAVERLRKRSLPERAACVTFDDGYADNAEVALPILQARHVPATFFIATGYLDGGRMWNDTVADAIGAIEGPSLDLDSWSMGVHRIDDASARRLAIESVLSKAKYLAPDAREGFARALAERAKLAPTGPMMTEGQVRTLRTAGMEIGAHSVTHPILLGMPDAAAQREITDSARRLAELLREPVSLFAYPNGKPGVDYGPEHVRMVREAGFTAAVSTRWGAADGNVDCFQLPRFTPWDRSPYRFAARLVRNLRAG